MLKSNRKVRESRQSLSFRLRRRYQFCRFSIRDRQSDVEGFADSDAGCERSDEGVSRAVSAFDDDLYARQFQGAAGLVETAHAVATRGHNDGPESCCKPLRCARG